MRSILIVTALGGSLLMQMPQVEKISAVRYEFGVEGAKVSNRFDSEKHTFVKDMVCRDEPAKKTRLRLSPDDYQRILAVANEARFFELPETLPPVPTCVAEPNSQGRLWIRTNLRAHVVSWDDCSDKEAQRAARVGQEVWDAIRATDAYKRLPEPKCVYL